MHKDNAIEEMKQMRYGSENDKRIHELNKEISLLRSHITVLEDTHDFQQINQLSASSVKRIKLEETLKQKEIAKKQMEELEKELKECYKKQEQEKKEEREKSRQLAFKDVKKAYKAHSVWDRMVATVNGKRPNWRRISKLSERELKHLWRVNQGDTAWAKETEYNNRKYNDKKLGSKKKTEQELREQNIKENWQRFLTEMQDDKTRELDMNYEEKHGGRVR